MNEIIKPGESGIVGLIHGQGSGLVIPQPFEREIFLFDTYVAGTTHIEGIEQLQESIKPDDKLEFFREPDNRYDSKAIVIKNTDGVKIGYVPKNDNAVFSRLMDAGKYLYGKVIEKEIKGKWVKIKIGIYLKD